MVSEFQREDDSRSDVGDMKALKKANTGNKRLTESLHKHVLSLLATNGLVVPNDPEEMRWRLFFAHSQDMYGFRADIFTGGIDEGDNPHNTSYLGLRDRWPNSRTMLVGLASLWMDTQGQKILRAITNPFRSPEEKVAGIRPSLDLLRGHLGNAATKIFADTFEEFKGNKIAHKTNTIVRAYCQNAAVLAKHEYCFRTYLYSLAPLSLPCKDISQNEQLWVNGIRRDFYNVGDALAPYLVADWLLGLWRDGQIPGFSLYKPDSVFLAATGTNVSPEQQYLPSEAARSAEAFISYCRTLYIPADWLPAHLKHLSLTSLPPRLVNEVIWLDNNTSTPVSKSLLSINNDPIIVNEAPTLLTDLASTHNAKTISHKGTSNSMLSTSDILPSVKNVLLSAEDSLCAYEILERLPTPLRDQLIQERGLPGLGSGKRYTAATLVAQAVEKLLPSKEAPYRVYRDVTNKTFTVAGHSISPGNPMIATYQLTESPTSTAVQIVPDVEAETALCPPGHSPDPNEPYVLVVSVVDIKVETKPDGNQSLQISPWVYLVDGYPMWAAFTSRHALYLAIGDQPNQRQLMQLSSLIDMLSQIYSIGIDNIKGIILDPAGPEPHVLTISDYERILNRPLDDDRAQILYPGTKTPVLPYTEILNRNSMISFLITDNIPPIKPTIMIPLSMSDTNGNLIVGFTSYDTLGKSTKGLPNDRRELPLSEFCQLYLAHCHHLGWEGILIDPGHSTEKTLTNAEIVHFAQGKIVETGIQMLQTDEILDMFPASIIINPNFLVMLTTILRRNEIEEGYAVIFVHTNLERTFALFLTLANIASEEKIVDLLDEIDNAFNQHPATKDQDFKLVITPLEALKDHSLPIEHGSRLLP